MVRPWPHGGVTDGRHMIRFEGGGKGERWLVPYVCNSPVLCLPWALAQKPAAATARAQAIILPLPGLTWKPPDDRTEIPKGHTSVLSKPFFSPPPPHLSASPPLRLSASSVASL
jgi:hypothetical protein